MARLSPGEAPNTFGFCWRISPHLQICCVCRGLAALTPGTGASLGPRRLQPAARRIPTPPCAAWRAAYAPRPPRPRAACVHRRRSAARPSSRSRATGPPRPYCRSQAPSARPSSSSRARGGTTRRSRANRAALVPALEIARGRDRHARAAFDVVSVDRRVHARDDAFRHHVVERTEMHHHRVHRRCDRRVDRRHVRLHRLLQHRRGVRSAIAASASPGANARRFSGRRSRSGSAWRSTCQRPRSACQRTTRTIAPLSSRRLARPSTRAHEP